MQAAWAYPEVVGPQHCISGSVRGRQAVLAAAGHGGARRACAAGCLRQLLPVWVTPRIQAQLQSEDLAVAIVRSWPGQTQTRRC